jgi:hypothetical protein
MYYRPAEGKLIGVGCILRIPQIPAKYHPQCEEDGCEGGGQEPFRCFRDSKSEHPIVVLSIDTRISGGVLEVKVTFAKVSFYQSKLWPLY